MDIINFDYGNHELRVLKDEVGNPWWVAKDLCNILGFGDAGQISRNLDEDEKTTLLIMQDGSNYKSKQVLINEPGLYTVILKSRKPEAKKFKRWVTHEVLPSIRKNGSYEVNGFMKGSKRSNNMYYKVADLCSNADKYLNGRASLRALEYFTGMPVDDLVDEIEDKEGSTATSSGIPESVASFVSAHCKQKPRSEVKCSEIYKKYVRYCDDNNLLKTYRGHFFKYLYKLGDYKKVRRGSGGKRSLYVVGISLK